MDAEDLSHKEEAKVANNVSTLEIEKKSKRNFANGIPYKVTGMMARHPSAVTSSCCVFILFIVLIAVVGGLMSITTGSEHDWTISSTDESRNLDALSDAEDRVDPLDGSLSGDQTEIFDAGLLHFLYRSRDGQTIFTPENLQNMCLTEQVVFNAPMFNDYCRKVNGQCEIPVTSIVQIFYAFDSFANYNCTLLPADLVSKVEADLYTSVQTQDGLSVNGSYVGEDFGDQPFTTKTQSVWYFGYPLVGFSS
ncbi:MAG: hypothetical protein AAGM67_20675, partial [Bacteroidota bacterium]